MKIKFQLLFLVAFLIFIPCKNAAAIKEIDLTYLCSIPERDISLFDAYLELSANATSLLLDEKVDMQEYREILLASVNKIQQKLMLKRNDTLYEIEQIKNTVHDEYGIKFKPNLNDSADLILLNKVLDKKQGNCLSLTFLYLILGEKLDIEIQAKAVPSHIFVCLSNDEDVNVETTEEGEIYSNEIYYDRFNLPENIYFYMKPLSKKHVLSLFLCSYAILFINEARFSDAEEILNVARSLCPMNPIVYSTLGELFFRKQDFQKAINQYKASVAIYKNHEVMNNLAAAYINNRNTSEAISVLNEVIILAPNYAIAYGNLGNAYFLQKQFKEAYAAFEKAIEFEPTLTTTENQFDFNQHGSALVITPSVKKTSEVQIPKLMEICQQMIAEEEKSNVIKKIDFDLKNIEIDDPNEMFHKGMQLVEKQSLLEALPYFIKALENGYAESGEYSLDG